MVFSIQNDLMHFILSGHVGSCCIFEFVLHRTWFITILKIQIWRYSDSAGMNRSYISVFSHYSCINKSMRKFLITIKIRNSNEHSMLTKISILQKRVELMSHLHIEDGSLRSYFYFLRILKIWTTSGWTFCNIIYLFFVSHYVLIKWILDCPIHGFHQFFDPRQKIEFSPLNLWIELWIKCLFI